MTPYHILSQHTLDVLLIHTKIIMLVAATMAAAKLLPKSTASLRYTLWFFLFIVILLTPIISKVTPQWRLALLQMSEPAIEESHMTNGDVPLAERPSPTVPREIKPTLTAASIQPSKKSMHLEWRAFTPPSNFCILVWLVGFLLANLRHVCGQIRLRRVLATAQPVADERTRSTWQEIVSRYRISFVVQVLRSDQISAPLAAGMARRIIILPHVYTKWSAAHLKYALLHEAAHIKRRDVIAHFFVHFVTTLHWFNPFVWFAQKQFIREREHACDDLVLAQIARPSDYANMLLDLARSSLRSSSVAYAGLPMARASQLERRLIAILSHEQHRGGFKFNALGAILPGLLITVPILTFSPCTSSAEGQKIDSAHTAVVIESLHYALQDDDGDVREEAIKTLGKIKGDRATELLFAALRESDDIDVQVTATKMLLGRGETSALQQFIDGLSHQDAKIRIRSAKILKELKHPHALPALVSALNDVDPEAQKQIVKAICELRTADAITPLAQQLQHEDYQVRALAAWGLGEIEDAATLPHLYAALKDPHGKVRVNAIESIGDHKQTDSAPFVMPLLQDPEWSVRREAIKVLVEIKAGGAVLDIIAALQDEERRVREAAASALGDLGDARAIPALSAALHDVSVDVRKEAADALGEIYEEK